MTDETGGEDMGGQEPGVGSVGEEAAKLLGVLSDWAQEQGSEAGEGLAGLAGHVAQAARSVDEHVATDDPECRWCPVCRTIHAVRACSPEVRDQLAGAAAQLMRAAAGLLVAVAPKPERGRPEGGERVQRIDLDDGPGPEDRP